MGASSRGKLGVVVKRAIVRAIVGQFGQPRGAIGNVAGWVMAHRPSNRQRNSWVAALLDVQPSDHVLEIVARNGNSGGVRFFTETEQKISAALPTNGAANNHKSGNRRTAAVVPGGITQLLARSPILRLVRLIVARLFQAHLSDGMIRCYFVHDQDILSHGP